MALTNWAKTGMKTIAFETFWSQMRLDSWKEETSKDPSQQSEKSVRAYLNVNPEGALLRESQDIIEELHMMSRIFSQQIQVIKDFKKALEGLNEREDRKQEQVLLENSNLAMQELNREGYHSQFLRVPKSTLLNAAELLEQVGARKAEIDDLEGAAKRTSQQVRLTIDCTIFSRAHITLKASRSVVSETTASRHNRGAYVP